MNYKKGWKELKAYIENLKSLYPVVSSEGYVVALTILAHMEALEKQPLSTIVYAIDTKEKRLALIGHIADTSPSEERLDVFKGNLERGKTYRYVLKVYCPYNGVGGKDEASLFVDWFNKNMKRYEANVRSRLEWHTEIREWKGKEEYKAIGEEIE